MNDKPNRIHLRGFASMDKDKQRKLASKGGKTAHANGKAHRFTSEEAREAGRKGGEAGRYRAQAERANRPAAIRAHTK